MSTMMLDTLLGLIPWIESMMPPLGSTPSHVPACKGYFEVGDRSLIPPGCYLSSHNCALRKAGKAEARPHWFAQALIIVNQVTDLRY
jgi:hypothetical protein